MGSVNPGAERRPDHMAYLLSRINRRLAAEAVPPTELSAALTVAQARLLDVIPASGCRIVDLSGELRVSKQGLGQIVAQLAAGGYLETVADPADRRAKLVRRTARGDEVIRTIRALLSRVEARWRREVGAERYAVFREVLNELVDQPSRARSRRTRAAPGGPG
jgi:DNA-binding MarR family transcriptional regulator